MPVTQVVFNSLAYRKSSLKTGVTMGCLAGSDNQSCGFEWQGFYRLLVVNYAGVRTADLNLVVRCIENPINVDVAAADFNLVSRI